MDQRTKTPFPIFLGSEIDQPKPEEALFHILPVPFEASVSYGRGTDTGPSSILHASWQLEALDGRSSPCDEGIYTHAPINVEGSPEQVIENIAQATSEIVSMEKLPVILGGEHTVTYGVIKGLIAAGERDFGVVQVDAHGDLREASQGNPYSHASVMKRVVDEDIPLFQLGVRALCAEELETRKVYDIRHLDADVLVPKNIQHFDLPDSFPEKVFFTLDISGIDPSIFPSTSKPVPGGLGWYQTLALFESVVKQRDILGFDITEFSPIEGFHAYQSSAALLAYKMMGTIQRNQ